MQLSFSQIRSVTTGAVSVYQQEDGIHFSRYTERQLAAFEKEARCFFKRAESTSGIRLDFYTDSRSLSVSAAAGGKFEVLVDGLSRFYQEFTEPGDFTFSMHEGNKRVTLILPSHTPGVIRSVSLDDGAQVTPLTYPRKFIFYGDSITQGYYSEKDSQSYAWLVTRYFDADSMILGVGGSNFYPDTVDDNGFDADVAFIAMGTNDYCGGFTLEQIRENCAEYIARVRNVHPKTKCFFITPTWRTDGEDVFPAGNLQDVRAALAEVATRQGLTVVDGYTLIPHLPEYFADGLHPNDLGFALYAQNLIKIINDCL